MLIVFNLDWGREYMRKKALISLALILIIIFLAVLYNSYLDNIKSNDSNLKSKAKELVTFYYDNLHNKQYEKALTLFNYDEPTFKKDVENLGKIKNYDVNLPAETNDWVRGVYYDKKENSYVVEVLAEVNYMNRSYVATEIVFVKEVKGQLKITKIITDDNFCSIRGSKVHLLGR